MIAIILVSLAVRGASGGFCEEAGWETVFLDDFSGSQLNMTSWTVRDLSTFDDSFCREAMCVAENVAVRNGALVLTAKSEKRGWANFTTGAVSTQNKAFWQATHDKPFRLCVSGLLPGGKGTGSGLWPAFWMMPNDHSCWPTHGEQDILEMINGDGLAHATYHYSRNHTCGEDNSLTAERAFPDFDENFHEYAIERRVDSLLFVYDGVVVLNSTRGNLPVVDVPWYLCVTPPIC